MRYRPVILVGKVEEKSHSITQECIEGSWALSQRSLKNYGVSVWIPFVSLKVREVLQIATNI